MIRKLECSSIRVDVNKEIDILKKAINCRSWISSNDKLTQMFNEQFF